MLPDIQSLSKAHPVAYMQSLDSCCVEYVGYKLEVIEGNKFEDGTAFDVGKLDSDGLIMTGIFLVGIFDCSTVGTTIFGVNVVAIVG